MKLILTINPFGLRLSSLKIGIIVSLIICTITFLTIEDFGITWDEPTYYHAGLKYVDWLKKPSLESIDKFWSYNTEHPPLIKVLGGLSIHLFHQKLQLLPFTISYRFPILLFVFILNLTLFTFCSELYGKVAALFAIIILNSLPRLFFHSHIGAMDYPITAMWFLVIYTYWKGLQNQKWLVFASFLLGIAFLTKLNAFFLYISIFSFWLFYYGKELMRIFIKPMNNNRAKIKTVFSKLLPMIAIPPIIFFTLWPWLWKDPLKRTLEYISFHLERNNIPVFYFGKLYYQVPWDYPFVLTFFTVPVLIIVFFLLGILKTCRAPHKNAKIFILINVLTPLLVLSVSNTKYDGVRLFLPSFPYIAMISGIGLIDVLSYIKRIKYSKIIIMALSLVFFLSFYYSILKYYPYHASFFNLIVGGIDGATEKGFEPEYRGSSYMGLLQWMEDHPENVYNVYFKSDHFYHYQKEGQLNPNIKFDSIHNADHLILLKRFSFFGKDGWYYHKYKLPVHSVHISHTDIVSIYKVDKSIH